MDTVESLFQKCRIINQTNTVVNSQYLAAGFHREKINFSLIKYIGLLRSSLKASARIADFFLI